MVQKNPWSETVNINGAIQRRGRFEFPDDGLLEIPPLRQFSRGVILPVISGKGTTSIAALSRSCKISKSSFGMPSSSLSSSLFSPSMLLSYCCYMSCCAEKYKAHKMVAIGLSHLSSSDGSCDRIHVSRPFLSLGSLFFTSLVLFVLSGHPLNQLIRIRSRTMDDSAWTFCI